MKALTLVVLSLTTVAFADGPPPPGDYTNTPPPLVTYTNTPRSIEHGAIHTTTTNAIAWWNFNNHGFTVEHRMELTDGSWTNIGEGFRRFEHNNPAGFYRVLDNNSAVFQIWNSGTDNMLWEAHSVTGGEFIISMECYNTNLIPEWGEGYLVVKTSAPSGTEIVIQVDSYEEGGAYDETKQVTVVVK